MACGGATGWAYGFRGAWSGCSASWPAAGWGYPGFTQSGQGGSRSFTSRVWSVAGWLLSPALIGVLLLLSVALAALTVQCMLGLGAVLPRFWTGLKTWWQRCLLPLSLLLLGAMAALAFYEHWREPVSLSQLAFTTLGIFAAVVAVSKWLTQDFRSSELDKTHFDQAMVEQTELIKQGIALQREDNAAILALLRAWLESRDAPAPPADGAED